MFKDILICLIGFGRFLSAIAWRRALGRSNLTVLKSAKARAPDNHNHSPLQRAQEVERALGSHIDFPRHEPTGRSPGDSAARLISSQHLRGCR